MRSSAVDVATYLGEVPEERRPVLDALRRRCTELLDGFEEVIEYGMPTYRRDGVPEVAWASQKRHIALYVMREDVVRRFDDRLAHLGVGKSCIQFRRPDDVDLDLVDDLLRATAASRGPIA